MRMFLLDGTGTGRSTGFSAKRFVMVFQAAAGNGSNGQEIMTLLLDRRGGDVPITEGRFRQRQPVRASVSPSVCTPTGEHSMVLC